MDDALQLSAFVAAAEVLHLGRAAERLGVHPSTVAARLRSLESRIGLVLVDRQHRCRISVTQAGVALLPAARRVLEAVSAFETRSAEVRAGARGVVRVALMSDADAGIEALVDDLRRVDPAWEVAVQRMDVGSAGRALAVGAVDCAIGRGDTAPRSSPGLADPRPNRLERLRVARIDPRSDGARPRRLVVAWRAAWELDDTRPEGGAHAAALVARVRRLRSIAARRRDAAAAARRREAEDRVRSALAERELRAEEVERFGSEEATARAAARERADVLRRVAEAEARGEPISVQLAVAWLCVQERERRGDDGDGRGGDGRDRRGDCR